MKSLFKLAVATAVLSAGISNAFAGTDSHVEISGNVTDVSCSLGPGGNAPTSIFLGNRESSAFAAGSGIYSGLNTVPDTKKEFTVVVSGCSAGTAAAGDAFGIKVLAYGKTLNGEGTLFGDPASPNQTSSAGAAIATTGASPQIVSDNMIVPVYTYADGDTLDVVNGKSVTFETMMASVGSNPTVGGIFAPVTFTITYP